MQVIRYIFSPCIFCFSTFLSYIFPKKGQAGVKMTKNENKMQHRSSCNLVGPLLVAWYMCRV